MVLVRSKRKKGNLRPPAKYRAVYQAGYDESGKRLEEICRVIKEKLPTICQWYVEQLKDILRIAGSDPGLIRAGWEGFKRELDNVPHLIEETLHEQYASTWEFFKEADMHHVLSGLIKQKVAEFTDRCQIN